MKKNVDIVSLQVYYNVLQCHWVRSIIDLLYSIHKCIQFKWPAPQQHYLDDKEEIQFSNDLNKNINFKIF